jgi:hypothetical protein
MPLFKKKKKAQIFVNENLGLKLKLFKMFQRTIKLNSDLELGYLDISLIIS